MIKRTNITVERRGEPVYIPNLIGNQVQALQAETVVSHNRAIDADFFKSMASKNLRVVNIVILGDFPEPVEIDFDKVKEHAKREGMEIKPMNRFPSLKMVLGGITIILFKNGKIIFTGKNRMSSVLKARRMLEKFLGDALGARNLHIELFVQNMVAMTYCEGFIDLETMCLSTSDIIYEPEQFPAAILKRTDQKGVFLIFANSKIICLGLKTEEEIKERVNDLMEKITPFFRHAMEQMEFEIKGQGDGEEDFLEA